MFVAQINVIFMRPLYEAVILCDCIIKNNTMSCTHVLKNKRFKLQRKLQSLDREVV